MIEQLDLRQLCEDYARDGVVFVDEVMDQSELTVVRSRIERYCNHVVPKLPDSVREKTVRFEPDGASIRSCYYMDEVDEYFRALGNTQRFKDLIEAVVGWTPHLYGVKTFNKYAETGTAVVLHQDVAFFNLEPKDMAHLWIAIDEATAENGAVYYWLGSHHAGLLRHAPEIHGYLAVAQELADSVATDVVPGILAPGSAAIHSGLVVHGSPPNPTDTPRLALLLGYRGTHTELIGYGVDTDP